MGILNVTPDSFSDGGAFLDPDVAIRHARRMVDDGADLIDVGAESTRPYGDAIAVPVEEELRRLDRVLPAIVRLGVPVSIDTMKTPVARWALDAGASIANDVWGLQRDPALAGLIAERGVPVIVMHNRERADPTLDIMADIKAFFARSLDIAGRAGIRRDAIVLDPGIGFGKTPEQSMTAIARLGELKSLGNRCWSAPHASASSTRPRPRPPIAASAVRSRLTFSRFSMAPQSSGRTTSPRPCRRCACSRRSGHERYDLCFRFADPCAPRRDGARGQGRPALRHRS
jgi:dihydropteroate synthase